MIRCVVSRIKHPPLCFDRDTSRADHGEIRDRVDHDESNCKPECPFKPRSAHTIDEPAVEKQDGNLDKTSAPEKQHFDNPSILIVTFVSYQDMQRPEEVANHSSLHPDAWFHIPKVLIHTVLVACWVQVSTESVTFDVLANAILMTTSMEEVVAIAHASRIKASSMPNVGPPR
jgi:hypothetical protein